MDAIHQDPQKPRKIADAGTRDILVRIHAGDLSVLTPDDLGMYPSLEESMTAHDWEALGKLAAKAMEDETPEGANRADEAEIAIRRGLWGGDEQSNWQMWIALWRIRPRDAMAELTRAQPDGKPGLVVTWISRRLSRPIRLVPPSIEATLELIASGSARTREVGLLLRASMARGETTEKPAKQPPGYGPGILPCIESPP